ncbi:hypothetical protein K9N50_02485 [bacterium]|nr:hypothetical protein [bacterium]
MAIKYKDTSEEEISIIVMDAFVVLAVVGVIISLMMRLGADIVSIQKEGLVWLKSGKPDSTYNNIIPIEGYDSKYKDFRDILRRFDLSNIEKNGRKNWDLDSLSNLRMVISKNPKYVFVDSIYLQYAFKPSDLMNQKMERYLFSRFHLGHIEEHIEENEEIFRCNEIISNEKILLREDIKVSKEENENNTIWLAHLSVRLYALDAYKDQYFWFFTVTDTTEIYNLMKPFLNEIGFEKEN